MGFETNDGRALQRLLDELGRLPGIGPKSAQRIAYHLLEADGGGAPPGAGHHRRDRAGALLPRVLQLRDGRHLLHLRRQHARPLHHLRGLRAARRLCHRARGRLPRPLPRAGRRHLAHGQDRARAAARARAFGPPRLGRGRGGHPRDQPRRGGRGAGDVPRAHHPRRWASAPSRLAIGLPVGARSNTPTRSRWAARSRRAESFSPAAKPQEGGRNGQR